MWMRAGRAGENELSFEFIIATSIPTASFLHTLATLSFCRHLSNAWCLQTLSSKSHQASKEPYLLHTAHCTLPIRCASRCTKSPVAFLARFCFQQYSLQEWCIRNEFRNSGHEITAPGSAGKERLLQHTVYWESQHTAETVMLEMLSQDNVSKI